MPCAHCPIHINPTSQLWFRILKPENSEGGSSHLLVGSIPMDSYIYIYIEIQGMKEMEGNGQLQSTCATLTQGFVYYIRSQLYA